MNDPHDDYDLSSEIEEGRRERHEHICRMRDMAQGIRPEWGDDDEGGNEE